MNNVISRKQGRIHYYLCRGRLGRGSNELGRGSIELGRGSNDLDRGCIDLGRGMLKYKISYPQNAQKCDGPTDGPTDGRTDRPTR